MRNGFDRTVGNALALSFRTSNPQGRYSRYRWTELLHRLSADTVYSGRTSTVSDLLGILRVSAAIGAKLQNTFFSLALFFILSDLALQLPLWKSPIHGHPLFPLFLKIWICGVFFGSCYGHLSGWDCQALLASHVVVLDFMEGVLLWRLYSNVHKEPTPSGLSILNYLHFIHLFRTPPATSF